MLQKTVRPKRAPLVRIALFVGALVLVSCYSYFTADGSAEAGTVHRSLLSVKADDPNIDIDPVEDSECNTITKFERYGGFVLEIAGVAHLFIGIAIVADDYFVASLEILADKLHMSPDIAGATLMAIGSSAPELFTNVASVLNSSADSGNDIGAGTIVGSALFNILVVIGLSVYVSPDSMKLAPGPVIRDVVVYIISICMLTYSMWDQLITKWEALIMVGVYGLYILYLAVSRYLFRLICPSRIKEFEAVEVASSEHDVLDVEMPAMDTSATVANVMGNKHLGGLEVPETEEERNRRLRKRSFDIKHVRKGLFRTGSIVPESTTARTKSTSNIGGVGEEMQVMSAEEAAKAFDDPTWTSVEEKKVDLDVVSIDDSDIISSGASKTEEEATVEIKLDDERKSSSRTGSGSAGDGNGANEDEENGSDNGEEEGEDEDDDEGPPGPIGRIYNFIALPYVYLFRYTVPDCNEGTGWEKWYLVAFLMSLVWIGVLTYGVVFLMTRIGCALHISTAIMGLTLVAAGTSVPDCIGSVLVARKGEGDMAVSNAVGSNIFDILVGLALPWTLSGFILHEVKVESSGLTISTLLLLGGLSVYAVLCLIQRFTLRKWSAYILCTAYILYVIYEVTAEILGVHSE